MAKKTIISDVVLRVGQSVVLMDSNLRGKIIGLGKTVRIELDDGLVIESSYGEFAVTDKAEIASLKDTKVKAKKPVTAPKQTIPTNPDGHLTIDLHIEAIPGGRNIPKGQQLQFLVAPQQRKAKQRKILIFNKNRDFLFSQKTQKKCGSRPPLVKKEVEQTGVPNISTSKECFSLIHNILHSVKTGSDSYICQINV